MKKGKRTKKRAAGSLKKETKEMLHLMAKTIRGLSMDAIQKANSGHPGMPMGCAEIGAYLFGHCLCHNPKNPEWMNRDRFILSAGHASMLLYSCLHLAGFPLSMHDIQEFRKLHSVTPGHPEKEESIGIETTTGPLGQGFGNAVGQALGSKMLAARFNTSKYSLFTQKVYVLMGDGCMMEGVVAEAASFAGHLGLDNLIAIYDYNQVTLDGRLEESCSEDTGKRFASYGWDVYKINGHDIGAIDREITKIKKKQTKPCLIIAKTVIGKGAPHKENSHRVHGAPLGEEEIQEAKKRLSMMTTPFFVPEELQRFFQDKNKKQAEKEEEWNALFKKWKKSHSALYKTFHAMKEGIISPDFEKKLWEEDIQTPVAGRKASHQVMNLLSKHFPKILAGSADLSSSDMTKIDSEALIRPKDFRGKNIKFGIREFSMGTIATGLAQTKMFFPVIGTFLVFSDYMRNAIRLCAMMKQKVVYHLTHDSVFLGEDGPTHQPVEHLASLRAIPNLQVIRPADANEVKMAWFAAMQHNGPTAIVLSRQGLETMPKTCVPYKKGLGRGAYILTGSQKRVDYTLVASGSELGLAQKVAEELVKLKFSVKVISMPSFEIFERQTKDYKERIFNDTLGKRVSIEAGVSLGWHKYILDGVCISIDRFGASAPYRHLEEFFGFTVKKILEQIV